MGLYEEVGIDPMSMRDFEFNVNFPSDYSTVCVESIESHRCSRDDTAVCDNFEQDRLATIVSL